MKSTLDLRRVRGSDVKSVTVGKVGVVPVSFESSTPDHEVEDIEDRKAIADAVDTLLMGD